MVHEPAHRNYSECPKQLEAIALEMGEFPCSHCRNGRLDRSDPGERILVRSGAGASHANPNGGIDSSGRTFKTRFGNNGRSDVGDPDVIG